MVRSAVFALLLIAGLAVAACDEGVSSAPSHGSAWRSDSPGASATPSASPSPSPSPPPKPKVSKAAFDYFLRIALGSEYGDKTTVVTKWTQDVVLVHVNGTVDSAGRTCLNRVIADFNALTATTDLRLSTAGGTPVELYFAPVSRFKTIEPHYVRGNDGFFYAHWNGASAITDAKVLIRTTGISDRTRCHHIRDSLTRAMGLMNESPDHPGSVFYSRSNPTPVTYSKLDKQVIKLLYSGAIQAGDDRAAVTRAVTVA